MLYSAIHQLKKIHDLYHKALMFRIGNAFLTTDDNTKAKNTIFVFSRNPIALKVFYSSLIFIDLDNVSVFVMISVHHTTGSPMRLTLKGLRGVILTPLRFFLNNSKTDGDFSTKFWLFLVYNLRRLVI